MTKQILISIFTLIFLTTFAQNKLKTLDELINKEDPGWTIVKNLISKSKNKVEILSADKSKAEDALLKTQVTTRSPMGANIYMTGGILVDSGWIRILGSGSEKLKRSLPDWNQGKSFENFGEQPKFLLIADDAVGGFFILNGGALGKDLGKIYYFSPDNLEYEPLNMTYSEFLDFCFNGNLEQFYKNLRWKNWEKDLEKLKGDEVYSFYPFLWTKEGKNLDKDSRKIIPVEEQYIFSIESRKQLVL